MKDFKFDFYDNTHIKSYDLDDSMRYQLAMLDSLDVFTRLHSENVANLTCRICEYMHYKDYFTIYCTICAYLHDIGKQFIPSAILQKNTRLTDEEYAVIKTHTTIGYNICMKDENLKPYAAGALYHHEALNGSGYPNGIGGEDLPLVGQIIRIADEFDAISSKRQYKSHVGVCNTLKILIEETNISQPYDSTDILSLDSKVHKSSKKKYGKINPTILKALIKVVLDDTEYELYNLGLYLNYLKDEIQRLEQISIYEDKMNKASKEADKSYYFEGIKQLLSSGENQDNYKQILEEYKQALAFRTEGYENLKLEQKNIKNLKV